MQSAQHLSHGHGIRREETEANAYLIAAAPDLLGACLAQTKLEHHAFNCEQCCGGGFCNVGSGLDSLANELREYAILKAQRDLDGA